MSSTASPSARADADRDAGLGQVLAEFPCVTAAWVFGSRARGDARDDSDLDLAILLRPRSSVAHDVYRELLTLAAKTERFAAGNKVDVVVLNGAGPILRYRVLAEGKLVYDADPKARVDFESDTYVEYFDFLPTYELAAKNAVGAVRAWLEHHR